ncbi:hypothetical protein EYZ11_004717 [Aspergillus tanneri]|uniref:Nucleoside phosphorylase domain-containing protein n=1 Tax=Aspergillus tanneri TaxID=1220188 RepID=A0A4S3JM51_9EURO|nr:hypothetical protein EYZ11_004717 [Aspergillus tanneri]
MAAATAMLDEIHEDLPVQPNDTNAYTLGRVGNHNVVLACLPSGQHGTTSATAVAIQLLSSFCSVRFGLMVGIGGGIPSSDADIRLGDIVVSQPCGTHGGVVQYDFGKALHGGQFQRMGTLNRPPQVLLTALARLQAKHRLNGSKVSPYIRDMIAKYPQMQQEYLPVHLFDELYAVGHHGVITRAARMINGPAIHYGLIASGNQVIKDGLMRDRLRQDFGAYCVEMEAAGLMNHYPCILIRGISDYADSHKNNTWQGYAAAAAAAYAKELLEVVPVSQVAQTKKAQNVLSTWGMLSNLYVPILNV